MIADANPIVMISLKLHDSKKKMKLRMLRKMIRPCRIAATMVAK